jgi:CCR4-NOT transcription complex subunit 7/8
VSGLNLPETEVEFFESLKLYFPNVYDVRYLVRNIENFRCSLSKLAEELKVVRIGMQHQAGSDSYVTSKVFYNLSFEYLTEEEIEASKGILFGIGSGIEDLNSFFNGSSFKNNSQKTTPYNYDNNQQIYSMNPLNIQYFNNNVRNNNLSNFNPYNNYNIQMQNNLPNIGNINYQTQQDYISMQNNYENNINSMNNLNNYQQNIATPNTKKNSSSKTNVIKA